MSFISIFNDVLGPVMRGPSSSHTAGGYRIARIVRDLLGEEPASVRCTFDPSGSYAPTYKALAVDLAIATGFLGRPLEDARFTQSLLDARDLGMDIRFDIAPLDKADHPNSVKIEASGRRPAAVVVRAKSVGGGIIEITHVQDWPVSVTGKSYEYLLEMDSASLPILEKFIAEHRTLVQDRTDAIRNERVLIHLQASAEIPEDQLDAVRRDLVDLRIYRSRPLFFIRRGEALFLSGRDMLALADEDASSLGEIGLRYELRLLGLSREETLREMVRLFGIMKTSVEQGLSDANSRMLLLPPFAGGVFEAEKQGKLAVGGIHARAAARAMATMHMCNSQGIVCAAPTGGSAGVLPGVLTTLAEEWDLAPDRIAPALFAASAIGLIVARRCGFAAETAGCQVEIGVAGAMAAAAVVEIAGGSARQACDAAAIAMQNAMGSVCDPVHGACEIPCHTRNGVAASSAMVCADLILGGYPNPIPLDETLDAVSDVGRMMPIELRCTARGGIAVAPSALAMKPRR
jgi:L-serine dehydratase